MQKERTEESRNTKWRGVRASESLRIYRTFEALARRKRESTAWALRNAAEKYVADKYFGRMTL